MGSRQRTGSLPKWTLGLEEKGEVGEGKPLVGVGAVSAGRGVERGREPEASRIRVERPERPPPLQADLGRPRPLVGGTCVEGGARGVGPP